MKSNKTPIKWKVVFGETPKYHKLNIFIDKDVPYKDVQPVHEPDICELIEGDTA